MNLLTLIPATKFHVRTQKKYRLSAIFFWFLCINSVDSYVPPYTAPATTAKPEEGCSNLITLRGDATKDCTPCRRKVS
jgi:hypothetical protein